MPLNWTEAHQEAMSQPATADSAASLTSSMHRHESGSDNSRGNSRPNSRDSVSFSSLRPQLDAQVNYYRTKHTHTHTPVRTRKGGGLYLRWACSECTGPGLVGASDADNRRAFQRDEN